MKTMFATLLSASILIGCASTPDYDIYYHLPKSMIDVEVTRALSCTDDNHLVEASSADIKARHIANKAKLHEINPKKLAHWFADSDITFEFYEDRRLKSVNSVNEGKGKEILASAFSLLPMASLGIINNKNANKTQLEKLCAAIKGPASPALQPQTNGQGNNPKAGAVAGAGDKADADDKKPKVRTATLKFIGTRDLSADQNDSPLVLISTADTRATQLRLAFAISQSGADEKTALMTLKNLIGSASAKISIDEGTLKPTETKTTKHQLIIQKTAAATVNASIEINGTILAVTGPKVFEVAGTGTYRLPIPQAAFFGGNEFELTLEGNGAVTKLSYKISSNAEGAFASGLAFDAATSGATYTQKAAEAKARAELLVAQQRIVVCQADPENCK